jgi:hypothetical protein
MTERHAWILIGGLLAAGAVVYLASKREIFASITAGEPTITYRSNEKPVGEWSAE